jgi:uncharacterized protein (DUF2345 family)
VSLQAHTDQLEILADKEITIISVNDVIEIKANQKIVLQAGQSSVTLEGGDITFACPGNFTVKGGQHVFDGGQNRAALMNKLPDSRLQLFDEAFILRNRITLEPMARQPYRLNFGYQRRSNSRITAVQKGSGSWFARTGAYRQRFQVQSRRQNSYHSRSTYEKI